MIAKIDRKYTDNKQVKSMYVFVKHVHNTYIGRHNSFFYKMSIDLCYLNLWAKIMYVLCTTHVRVKQTRTCL